MSSSEWPLWRALFLIVSMVILFSPVLSQAQSNDLDSWLLGLRQEAAMEGISASTLDNALAHVKLRKEIFEKDRNQPEFKLTLAQYLARIVSEERVKKGWLNFNQHRVLLEKIAARYQVQPRFLVALWGMESDFGRLPGEEPVISSLVTLAYDQRRSVYFRKELLHALHILDDGLIPLSRLNGSWAGAMGGLQFMPSSFRDYAIDDDQDGMIDLWTNHRDLFASGANYLSRSGWRSDHTWGREVVMTKEIRGDFIGHGCVKRLDEWQALGVRRLNGDDLPSRYDLVASLVMPENSAGRTFLAYDNYRVLLKWNRSDYFAIAVGLLSDSFKE
ncbi:MAG: lytic murein transglycosylase [Proteobacteria bacterium]|nr:lytic murein transglycosylase [Pseudomonadota bacterium]MBU1715772.1 lytic murein transglycosylase [Pseudomonadota bacterium]